MRLLTVIFVLLLIVQQFGCKENLSGDINDNQSPETFTVVDTIVRFGDQRLKTQLTIRWWGNDPDGFVSGYEISFDNQNWTFTSEQDSTLLVKIPEGKDTFDFSFYVRAIDNENFTDPTPAYLVFPVKNSPPDVEIVYPSGSQSNPARKPHNTLPVLKFEWNGFDPDGNDGLDHYEIFLNDSTQAPVIVDAAFSSVVLEAVNPQAATSDCKVYMGSSLTENPDLLQGLKLNDTNVFMIRAVDIVGEMSPFDKSYKIFVRSQNSKTLLVNAYDKNIDTRETFYTDYLDASGVTSYDVIRVNEVDGTRYTQLAPDNITQAKIFEYYDVLIWFGKEVSFSMSLAQRTTDEFFNQGGKMFMAVEISSSIDDQAGYLDFSPVDSLVAIPPNANNFVIERSEVKPLNTGWPYLKTSKIIQSTRPYYENVNSVPLYDADITVISGTGKQKWTGKSTVIAKKEVGGKASFVFSSVELHNFNEYNNMDSLFTKIFIDELGL